MASGDGVITRQEIITDEALSFGKEYRKNVDEAIRANDELINQFKILLKITSDYRKAQNTNDFREQKAKEQKVNQEILNLIKETEQAERALERIKQEKLRTEKEMAKVAQENVKLSKMQNQVQKQNKTLTMEERVQQQLKNQTDKQAVLEKMGLIGAYQKLNKQRTESKKRLQDLIATGTASNAQIRQAQKEFDLLDKKVKKADHAVGDFTKNVGNYKSAIGNLTRELASVFGWTGAIAGAAMLLKSFKDVIFDFDDGLLSVSKTTGIADQGLKNLGVNIRLLSQELKVVPINKLLEYATVAGQLGVKGSNNIVMFTESLAKLETASNITGEEGGAEIARMLTLIDGGVHTVKAFGDEIVHLGNNFATTEKEILSNATSIAQNVSVYKTSRQDVLAYGTATKAVGIESELAGSKIGKAMKLLEASIRTGENISAVMQFTGMSVDELKVKFKEDSGGVLFKFIEGLNGIDKAGGSVIGTLNELGIKEERQERVLSSLATGGFETLRRAMYDVKDASGAMQEEFETASGKMKNSVVAVGVAWDNLVLAINSSENTVGNVANMWLIGLTMIIDKIREATTSWKELNRVAGEKIEQESFDDIRNNFKNYNNDKDSRKNASDYFKQMKKEESKIIKEIQEEREKIKNWNDEKLMSSWMYFGLNKEDDSEKKISKLSKDLAVVQGTMKGINSLADDYNKLQFKSNAEFTNEATAEETDKERKKRESAAIKAQKEAEKREDERLKKLKESYEAEIDLKIWKADNLAEINKVESTNEKNTQDERYNALIAYQKAEEESLRLNVEKQLTLARSFQKNKEAFTQDELNHLTTKKDILNQVNTLTNEELLILEKFYAAQEKLRKDNEKGLKENVKFEATKAVNKIQLDNDKAAEKEIGALNIGNNLVDVERYEKAVYEIKRKYLLKTLEEQLKYYDDLVEKEKQNGTVTQEILDKQLLFQKEVREFNNETHVETLEKAKELEQRFIEMGQNIKNALIDLTNAIFDNRIQRIDEDIERSDAYFEKQIENYEGDATRQKVLRAEQEKEREKLEAKKRKEQHKQAIFNKAMAITDIGWNTAKAIMSAMADFPGPIGIALAIGAGIAGAVQTAAVLASPIPKYKAGRKGGPEEFAIVGDGGVHEVIERKDGSIALTPNRDTLVKLFEGDTVHASLDLYRKTRENKINSDLYKHQMRFDAYNSLPQYDVAKLEQKLDTLIDVLKKKNLSTVVNVPKVDFEHQLWLEKQKNW